MNYGSELYNIVQAASKNDFTSLSENVIKNFSSVISNLDYGWDSSTMYKVKDHFKDLISKTVFFQRNMVKKKEAAITLTAGQTNRD